MKIKGKTITWQRVLGFLYFWGMVLCTLPLIMLGIVLVLISFVFNFFGSFTEKLSDKLLWIRDYVWYKYFMWDTVFKWVKQSVDKARAKHETK